MPRNHHKTVHLGRLIRELRKTRGMSQMKLAEELDVTYQQVQKYENGTTKVSVSRLVQIANILGVPAQELMNAEPAMAENMASPLSEEEINLLLLFRRIKDEKIQKGFLDLLRDFLKSYEHKAP
jgi:transcriptional regulator with XRE-family HTH domain